MNETESNPYIAPSSPAVPPPVHFQTSQPPYFRDGKFLVIRDGTEMPDVCLRTNEDLAGRGWRKKVPIVWTPPWAFFLILVSPIIFVIVAIIIQKKAKFTYSLSKDSRAKIIRRRIIGFALLLAAIGLISMGIAQGDPDTLPIFVIGGVVSLIACLIPFAIANPIKVAGFENGWFKIKGCSPAFLDSISS